MKTILKLALFFLFIISIYLYSIYYEWGNNIDIYLIDSGIPGPNLLVIAGTHGNEPAGRVTIETWLDSEGYKSKDLRGKIYVIPRANKSGAQLHVRYMVHNLRYPDLNRNYTDVGREPISQKIISLIKEKQIDFILDYHEGWGFRKQNPKTIGSTLSATTPFSTDLANEIISLLNKEIDDENRHFVLNKKTDHLMTLRNYAGRHDIHYILVETTGQNNIQPLNVRNHQSRKILDYILSILEYS
jgi:predicted deacylase